MTATSASVEGERPPRLDGLTGLRWWAAFMVFLYHVQIFAPVPGPLFSVLRMGYLGVTFFFVLSGFVLTWSWSPLVKRSTFYLRRFARIYPSHVAAWLLAVPVFYAILPISVPDFVKPADPWVLGLSLVLLQGWFTVPAILFAGNPAAWTLTVEFFFYAFHPFAQRALRALTLRRTLVAVLVIILVALLYRASAWIFAGTWWADLPAPIQHTPEFLLGMALAWAFRQGWRPRLPVWPGLAAMALVVVALAGLPAFVPEIVVAETVVRFGNELFTVACALLIAGIVSSAFAGRRSSFGGRLQVRLGEWSFAFYLVHATVIYAALWLWPPLAPSWWNLLPALALLAIGLLLAAALFHGVERPLERRMRRWKDRRDETASGSTIGRRTRERSTRQ